ncbi:MAG: ribonuclease III [Candidatus Pacebacteria bacterium]|nr:ribonuclease III [Candidatus Paceibacterota bacterium]
MNTVYNDFESKIGVFFNNKDLLKQAFIHRSYINEQKDSGLEHNERLEFLGDAVLELVVTDFLYKKYPSVAEGRLTAYRSALVRTESISRSARNMGMNDLLLLSKGEAQDQGKARDYILANTFEAYVGAVYLDQGYDLARDVIANHLLDNIEDIIKEGSWRDAKSYVQEKSQELYNETPRYELVSSEGPDHAKNFVMAIYFGDRKIAEGSGNSKQKAQQSAAQAALTKEGWDEE